MLFGFTCVGVLVVALLVFLWFRFRPIPLRVMSYRELLDRMSEEHCNWLEIRATSSGPVPPDTKVGVDGYCLKTVLRFTGLIDRTPVVRYSETRNEPTGASTLVEALNEIDAAGEMVAIRVLKLIEDLQTGGMKLRFRVILENVLGQSTVEFTEIGLLRDALRIYRRGINTEV